MLILVNFYIQKSHVSDGVAKECQRCLNMLRGCAEDLQFLLTPIFPPVWGSTIFPIQQL